MPKTLLALINVLKIEIQKGLIAFITLCFEELYLIFYKNLSLAATYLTLRLLYYCMYMRFKFVTKKKYIDITSSIRSIRNSIKFKDKLFTSVNFQMK